MCRSVTLVNLATQKFIAEIAHEALQVRECGTRRTAHARQVCKQRQSAGGKRATKVSPGGMQPRMTAMRCRTRSTC